MGVGPAAAVKIAASESLSAFHLAKYRFTLCATTEIILPVYKGSATHGGFGHALQHISPAFFKMLYQPPGKDSPPKPFVLTPPLASKTDYQPGEQFEIELVLIGNATQHLPVCFAALDALGQQLGFGTNKGRYQIERVDFCDASGDYQPLFQGGIWQFGHNVVNGQQIADPLPPVKERVTIQLQTRLRLKHNDHLLKQSPDFRLLLDRLLGRLCTLANFYQPQPLLLRETRNELLAAAEVVCIVDDQVVWEEWCRFSGRQKEWMKFGGLIGEVTYEGDLSLLMPYLKLGEWVHVGGKTSFGLGKYKIIAE
ncbi:MAG: CRISPR system precrRNA processing endoribonuclease RAMP protein Cas6 [Thiotrichaceae bacterium]|nr:CRISPR system precrRNA processing endoribonuclease RAMP protein Cas6 [Thiotrichaceae bacterium]PCI13448.1 MAG: cytosolic protein [Thiotrichales bacterium]